jgi:hypothetical protein
MDLEGHVRDAAVSLYVFENARRADLGATRWRICFGPGRSVLGAIHVQRALYPGAYAEAAHIRFLEAPPPAELYRGMPLVLEIEDRATARATIRTISSKFERPPPIGVSEVEWWLSDCSLPDLLWARLRTFHDGSADILHSDATLERFDARDDAASSLSEDEYIDLEGCDFSDRPEFQSLPTIWPPEVATEDMAGRMFQRWHSESHSWRPKAG